MEGRDIGSVVFPNADVKIYLDASPEERARRRAADPAHGLSRAAAASDVALELEARDLSDRTRSSSPLMVPQDAIRSTQRRCRSMKQSSACSRLSGRRWALERDDGLRPTLPDKTVRLVPPDVGDERRPETGQARAAFVPHARIDNAERSGFEQSFCQGL